MGTEDEMVGWHYQLIEHEPGQTLGEIVKGKDTCHVEFLRVSTS